MKHIRIVVLALCACSMSAAWAQQPPASNPLNNWSEFLTTNMDRYNAAENTINVSNVKNLKLKWIYPVGTDTPSSAVVANGVAYLQTVSGSFGAMFALKGRAGTLLWSFDEDIDGGSTSTPAVDNGVVYFGNFFGLVQASDATTGAMLWGNRLGDFIESSPAVAHGMVFVGASLHFSGPGGSVNALDAATGNLVWSFPTSDFVDSSPAVVGNAVYVGSNDHNVYALRVRTGEMLWSFATGGAVQSSAAVVNGVVYIGSQDNNLYALNATTGAKLWSFTTGGSVNSSPAVANGVVYVGSDDGNLYALNASSGTKLWSFATGGGVSSPAVANGVVYIGSPSARGRGANLYALNASTGAKLFSYIPNIPASETCSCSPSVANGQVYFGSSTHGFAAFGLN
ncbi:MAG: PQQ-binding-like beta-propeller repeat protein [Candidatus Sulfotelmatobacter sp.]